MTLRALTSLTGIDVDDLRPRRIVGAVPSLEMVRPGDVYVDETYQRDIVATRSRKLITTIAREWDWRKFKPPILVKNEEGLLCAIDGQHTTTGAITRGDIAHVPALVHHGVSLADAARAFIGHNRDNLRVTPVQIFFAALAVGDADAVRMKRVCDAAGVRITRSPQVPANCRPGDMHVFGQVQQYLRQYGDAEVRDLLAVAARGGAQPITAVLLRALEYLRFNENCRGDWRPDVYEILIRNYGLRLEAEGRRRAVEAEISQAYVGMALFMYEKRCNWRQ